ncbi:hypothetical protein BH23GEM6_BH23GEM6_08520 [soil metagenome]
MSNRSERKKSGGGTDPNTPDSQLESENAAPRKQHGDALLTGEGTRHGVEKRDERPNVGSEEGQPEG